MLLGYCKVKFKIIGRQRVSLPKAFPAPQSPFCSPKLLAGFLLQLTTGSSPVLRGLALLMKGSLFFRTGGFAQAPDSQITPGSVLGLFILHWECLVVRFS